MMYLLIALFFPLFLLADSAPSSISSTHASYNGNKLFLEGNVKLDHEFGLMAANEAYLEKDEKLKDIFSLIHLQKEVLLNFKNHGQMHCEVADLNFQTLKGKFFPKLGEKILYTELLEKVKGKEALLKLNSQLAEIKLSKNEKEYQIDEIEALKEVLVEYGQDFVLKAGRALFRQQEKLATLLAYPEEGSFCALSHLGDVLYAKMIEFDLKQLKLVLHNTYGVLESLLFPQFQKEKISFKAGQLIWDHAQGILKLQGGAFVEEGLYGSIQTEEEMELKQVVHNKTKKLKTITAAGNTTLKYTDPETESVHQLHCQGPIIVDREGLHAILESPKQQDGIVAEEMQIAYEHESMEIRANRADVKYQADDKGTRLSSLFLEGNVRLSIEESDKPSKLAIADKVDLSPSDNAVLLSASPGKKVLFWDAEQQLSISARQVKIERDPITGKDSVRGIGNVKFAFDTVEQSLLQKIFPFYEPPSAVSDETD